MSGLAEQEWAVYTMTHDDDMYDDDGTPVDDDDWPEWCVGAGVNFAGHPYEARSARPVAGEMTYGMAVHIASVHNLWLAGQGS